MRWPLLRATLESKLGLLRILCFVVVAGWVGAFVWIATVMALLLLGPDVKLFRVFFSVPSALLLLLCMIVVSIANLLLYLPTCARCSERLFGNNPNNRPPAFRMQARDYRAKSFFWSYRSGGVLELVRTGQLKCMWCGHTFGTEPDNTVTKLQ